MSTNRQEFINELRLREQIRKIIKVAKSKKAAQTEQRLLEEKHLRLHIRDIIDEITDPASKPRHRATGIRILTEEVLQTIMGTFKKYYMQLDNVEKRESFRSHIINAAENLLNTIDSGQTESESAMIVEPTEEVPLAEQDVSMTVDSPASPADDPRFLPMEDENPDPDQAAQQEFRSGMDSELSPDQETGALRAQTAFNGPDTTIKKAYTDLRGRDAELFREYLITNLKLHFDTMEEELSMTPEPTTPSYEEASAEELPPEEGIPPGPEGAPMPPEEEMGPPAEAGPMPPVGV